MSASLLLLISFLSLPPTGFAWGLRAHTDVMQPEVDDGLSPEAFTSFMMGGWLEKPPSEVLDFSSDALDEQLWDEINPDDGVYPLLEVPREEEPHLSGLSLAWPVMGELSSHYGRRGHRRHEGIDIRAPRGSEVYAAADGRVIYAARYADYGNVVVIAHAEGWVTLYAHHEHNLVQKGQEVTRGQLIARVGLTGRTTGAHLHFELRRGMQSRNPLHYLSAQP